jgi:hypothetical protein
MALWLWPTSHLSDIIRSSLPLSRGRVAPLLNGGARHAKSDSDRRALKHHVRKTVTKMGFDDKVGLVEIVFDEGGHLTLSSAAKRD